MRRTTMSKAAPLGSSLILFASLVGAANLAKAGTAAERIAQAAYQLAGDGSKEWVLARIRTVMGSADECTAGEVYRFESGGGLTIEKCEDGKLATTSRRWSLAVEGPLDVVLTIDSEPYLLLFKDDGSAHLMRLRQRSASKASPTVDREFRLSDD